MNSLLKAINMSLCAAFAVFLALNFNFYAWVLFLTWTTYVLFVKSPKSALLLLVQHAAGMLLGFGMQVLGAYFAGKEVSLAIPLAVFILELPLFYVTKTKNLNNLAAYFIGLSIWFGAQMSPEPKSVLILLIPVAIGFGFGFVNGNINKLIDAKLQKK